MVILDTDHLTFLERGTGTQARRLIARLASVAPDQVTTTVITYEEQTRGWLAYIARERTMAGQVEGYARLQQHLETYKRIPVLAFDQSAAIEFQSLKVLRVRVGTFDLKIAAIALARGALLLSRNLADFKQVPGLRVEDWTA
jgi:tRNA(fMet)-specific endonuclease VapC